MADDEELQAMATAYRALAGLDETQRKRALHWLIEKFDRPVSAAQTAKAVEPPKPESRLAELPRGLAAFVRQKQPQTKMQTLVCYLYWGSIERGADSVTVHELNEWNRLAGENRFSDAASIAQSAMTRKWVQRAGAGAYRLTGTGRAMVEALPDGSP